MLIFVRSILQWLGGHISLVLVASLLLVVCGWAFIFTADKVMAGKTQHFDEWAVRALRRPENPAVPVGPAWLEEVGRDLTALGGMAVLSLITVAVVGFLLLKEKYRLSWLVLLAIIGGLVISLALKHLYERPRPQLVPHLSGVYTTSFPSGHSMLSAIIYLTLGSLLARAVRERSIKFYFVAVALVLTFLVGVSRVYMGVHYPTDVLAGWSAGLAWALLWWLIARFLQETGSVDAEAD